MVRREKDVEGERADASSGERSRINDATIIFMVHVCYIDCDDDERWGELWCRHLLIRIVAGSDLVMVSLYDADIAPHMF